MADQVPSAITDKRLSLNPSTLTYCLHRNAGEEGKEGKFDVLCDVPERGQSSEWYRVRGADAPNGLSFNCTAVLQK